VVLGPSGAGKSLLIETILGLRSHREGEIKFNGKPFLNDNDLPPISYLPQDLALFPHLSVLDNIIFGAKVRKTSTSIIERKVNELVDLLKIGHLLNRRHPDSLSMGEKQRVALARALIIEPQILFLDEPFSSLDHYIKRQLIENLHQIKKRFLVTIFHATHDQEEAFMLADQMAILFDGVNEQVGNPADIQQRPANQKVARLLMAQNILDGKIEKIDSEKNKMLICTGGIKLISPIIKDLSCGQDVSIVIRPEDIHIIRPNRPLGPKVRENLFDACIERTVRIPGGHILSVHIAGIDHTLEICLSKCAFKDMELKAGMAIRVCINSESLWSMPKCS